MAIKRIGFGRLAIELRRLQMQPGQGADDFEMAEFFGADIHQQVLALRILAVEPLDRILHRRGEFAVGAAELFQQHIAEARIGFVDTDGVHEFLDVVVHRERLVVIGVMGVQPEQGSNVPINSLVLCSRGEVAYPIIL